MAKGSPRSRFLIQIEHLGGTLDMPAARTLLAGTGVELDQTYGPILVNPARGRYVVRGRASRAARAKAEALPGVRFFSDAGISPAR
jgi:hypothetical protein